jgi:hypothetical protein
MLGESNAHSRFEVRNPWAFALKAFDTIASLGFALMLSAPALRPQAPPDPLAVERYEKKS